MRENAFKVLWGLDNTAGLNVICVTLAINDTPNFHYFWKRLFIYFHVSDSWGMGLRGTCLCRKVLSDIHFHAPKRAEVPPKEVTCLGRKEICYEIEKTLWLQHQQSLCSHKYTMYSSLASPTSLRLA